MTLGWESIVERILRDSGLLPLMITSRIIIEKV